MRANNPTLALGLGLALSMMGCGKPTPTLGSPTSAKETAISFVKPEKRSLVRIVEQPGSIQAFEETILYPKIPGYIQTLSLDPAKVNRPVHDRAFDLGSRVKANTVLAELSIPELDEELKQKEAMIRQSNAEVSQAKKALAVSEAAIVAAKAQVTETRASLTRAQALYDRWRSEMDRVNRLVNNGVIDSQTKDETQNQFKAAEATRSEVEAKVVSSEAAVSKAVADREKSVADVVTSEARLDVSKAEVRKIIALLAYTRVKAPFDGVITVSYTHLTLPTICSV